MHKPLFSISTTWQFFIAIAGVGLVLVMVSMLGLRLFFTYNFNAYLAAQEQQRLEELAVLVADFYTLRQAEDPNFQLRELGDLQRGGARRLLAGLSLAQWRDDSRSARSSVEGSMRNPGGRLNFRNIQLYDPYGVRIEEAWLGSSELLNLQSRESQTEIRVPIMAGDPTERIGYLGAPRPAGPLQPIDAVFQQQQLSALVIAAGLAIVFAALAAAWLASRLRRRLKWLGVATRQLARGDYQTQVPVYGHDDLAALAADVNQLAFSLQAASRQRRDFMSDMAHELRTPLTILQAEIEAMQDGIRPLSAEQIGLLQLQVQQLTQLVEDVNTLAQAEVGSLNYRWQTMNLNEWLQVQWASLQHQADHIGLKAALKLSTQPLMVRGDAERLTQLLQNLWSNSLRYTHVPGQIVVKLNEQDGHAILSIEDSAPSVESQHLDAIFTRLYRVDSSRNRTQGGSGIGLAVVKRIVEAHQGQVSAKISPLGGLSVQVSVPLAARRVEDDFDNNVE